MEDIISDVETQMENALEITKVISAGNISGSLNSMAGCDYMDEAELEKDLAELFNEEEGIVDVLETLQSSKVVPEQAVCEHVVPEQMTHVDKTPKTEMQCV